MADPKDQPEEEGYGLLYPFTVVTSVGGPYDDAAFVAGMAVGQIDKALTVLLAAGVERFRVTVRTDLVHQLELVGMARGFPVLHAATDADLPEWTLVEFFTEEPDEDWEEVPRG